MFDSRRPVLSSGFIPEQHDRSRRGEALSSAQSPISPIVGGIGIMNLMLVSDTETTREIGPRQAMGARTRDILSQFLVEAVTLSLLAGIIGIVVGVAASLLISCFPRWSTHVGSLSALMALVFSALLGVSFGYYPTRKAAFLDPIDALKYEYASASAARRASTLLRQHCRSTLIRRAGTHGTVSVQ